MDVVIISNYWHFPAEKSSSRYNSIVSYASDAEMSVEVITSTFYHTKKAHRSKTGFGNQYKVTLINESGYSKNISLKRVLSHRRFSKGVLSYLKSRKTPDVIYLFVPPTGLAQRVVKFANKNNIRVVIDILDLWPEAFKMFLPDFIAKPLLYPMKHSVEYAYSNADSVVAVSNTYVQRAIKNNKKCAHGHSVFIGTDLSVFDAAAENAAELDGKLRPITMAYIGMLGHSYNLCGVMDAMELLKNQGFDNVEFLVMGDGPLREKFEHYAEEKNLPVRFTGRLSYEEMVKKLVKCDIGLNVLVDTAAQSIINKHADYVAAGIPVINVQKNQEFGELLDKYNAGFMCKPGDTAELAEKIKKLATDDELRKQMGANSRRLAEEKFDRNKTYKEIIDVIKGEIK